MSGPAPRVLLHGDEIARIVSRLAHQILEPEDAQRGLVLLGVRRGGEALAMRLAAAIERISGKSPALGFLNINLYRDDRVTHELPESQIPVDVLGRVVVVVDDVLYTGRTVRSALDAVTDLGRPAAIRLCVLVDRGLRELPIQPDYIGRFIATTPHERVKVALSAEGAESDEVTTPENPVRIRRSLLDLDDLTAEELTYVFDRTGEFENSPPGALLNGVACVNMFFEQSTRTFASFNLAQLRLGAHVVNLAPKNLSLETKGETLEDTAITLSALGVSVVVIRHSEGGFPQRMALAFDGHVINAGDGAHAHPTQALLDIYTMIEEFGDLGNRAVAIVGDVLHSRVAHSTIRGLQRLGTEVVLVGPEGFLPSTYSGNGIKVERDFDAVLPHVDAVVLLRIQRERFAEMPLSDAEYVAGYRLDRRRLSLVRRDAIVMHPGPYNRGMELDDSVLQFAGWRYARQVHHGIAVRMAVLDFLVNAKNA